MDTNRIRSLFLFIIKMMSRAYKIVDEMSVHVIIVCHRPIWPSAVFIIQRFRSSPYSVVTLPKFDFKPKNGNAYRLQLGRRLTRPGAVPPATYELILIYIINQEISLSVLLSEINRTTVVILVIKFI